MAPNKPMIAVAAVVIAAAVGGWFFLHHRSTVATVPVEATRPPPAASPPEAVIAHPLPSAPEASESKVPLPPLADSDPALSDALSQIAGAETVKDFLQPENMVRRLVVTVDNLPRQKVAVEKRPTLPIATPFVADGDELHATLDPRNFKRYEPMVAVIRKLDMQKLAAVYIRFYPLFQNAYQDLGYPNGYFNDRLIKVIDVLLAAPTPSGPVELVRPNVMYQFADPDLEARPAGQKLMIRMGPENAAAVKTKLMELRATLTAGPLKH